jgi:hypothetical protein
MHNLWSGAGFDVSADRLCRADGRLDWSALALFAILYAWQFPHFYAIAWMY